MAPRVTSGLRGPLPAVVMQALSVAYALVELGRLAAAGSSRNVVIGAVAALIFLPLHAQHLRYGLRGLRPPRGELTLGVMVVVNAVALALIGPLWAFMLAILATSALIVLRPPGGFAVLATCCLAIYLTSLAFTNMAPISGNRLDPCTGCWSARWSSSPWFAWSRWPIS